MTLDPTNKIVGCLGRKGTGKSELLHRLYVSKAPRVLSIGVLPQDLARDPNAVVALGWAQLMDTFKQAAAHETWHIATALEPEDIARLFLLLAPPQGNTDRSLSIAFGGMALCINELYDVAPNPGAPLEVNRAPRVGRHCLLDIFFATQRPASCSRDFTAAADQLYAFAQSEPRDLDYLAKAITKPVAQRIAQLTAESHDYVHFNRETGVARHVTGDGRRIAVLNTMAGQPAGLEGDRKRSLAAQQASV